MVRQSKKHFNTVLIVLFLTAVVSCLLLPAVRVEGRSSSGRRALKKKAARLADEKALKLELKQQEEMILAEQNYRRGRELFGAGRIAEAKAAFATALEANPDHRDAGHYFKRCLRQEEKKAEKLNGKKIPAGKETGTRDSGDKARKGRADTYLKKGSEYFKRGEYLKAIEEWIKILPLTDPLDADHIKARILIKEAQRAYISKEVEKTKAERKLGDFRILTDVDRGWVVESKQIGEATARKKSPHERKLMLAEKAQQRISFSFENALLRDVIIDLSKMSGVNIVLDETIFSEQRLIRSAVPGYRETAGESKEAQGPLRAISPLVTMSLENVSLIEALDIILRSKGLRYRLEPNLIYVSTPMGLSDGELLTRVYHLKTGIAAIPEIELKEWETGTEED